MPYPARSPMPTFITTRPALALLLAAFAVVTAGGTAPSSGARAQGQVAPVVPIAPIAPSQPAAALDQYTVHVDAAAFERLRREGRDIAAVRPAAGGFDVDLVVTADDARMLKADRRLPVALWRDPIGRTASQLAAEQAEDGYAVWRKYDGPGGFRELADEVAKAHPELVKHVVIGTSVQGRPIVALKVTKDANSTPDGARPAVLYMALQHAREWIGPEVAWRLLEHFVDGYGTDAAVTALVDSREFWFVPIANPDGYEHTFTPDNRLWRKTMRDNNGDGAFDPSDGVDPNRNFPEHWGYDEEGSSSQPGAQTYRGPAAGSEPETQAIVGLLARVPFRFLVNYHSVAQLLLYGIGWQVETVSADTPIHEALAGTPAEPAVPGFVPELSARLYTTNGETCDYAITVARATCFTPELSDGGSGGGFVFPDDEALVQAEFVKNLPFALDVAMSAADPARPVSHLGNTVTPFYVDAFGVSYGDPQPVQVNAARYLGEVTLHYRVAGGDERTATTAEWDGGERYGDAGDIHYHRVRGTVTGARPGDRVEVWFTAGDAASTPFAYTLASVPTARVLVVAAEDYTGAFPTPSKTDGPSHLAAHLDALAANGITADVYDIDARGRVAPDPLGVLGHYDAVLWYTGADSATAAAGMVDGTVSRLANDAMLAMRDYLNEGGRLLYSGQWAGRQYAQQLQYDPDRDDAPCGPDHPEAHCVPLSNDFLQYYLGAYTYADLARPGFTHPNRAGDGAGGGLWSSWGDVAEHAAWRDFDLTDMQAPVVVAFDADWNLEADWDFGYVEVSADGGTTWTVLPDMGGRTVVSTEASDTNLGPALNGVGHDRLRYDLSAFAGRTVRLRLRYLTDWGTISPGWWVDGLAITDATGERFRDDFDGDIAGWTLDGWARTPEVVPPVPVADGLGNGDPLGDLRWSFGGAGVVTPTHSAALSPTSGTLSIDLHPQFESRQTVLWAGEDAPHGRYFVDSGRVGEGYLRLTRTIDVPAAADADKHMTLRIKYGGYDPWNTVFVEAHTVGQDDWTTLPDANGHTRPGAQLSACRYADWFTRHPQLAHYLTLQAARVPVNCKPVGTTGVWYASTGASDGWEEWSIDLARFAGRQVEIAISHVSWAETTGVAIDMIRVPGGAMASFEADFDGWRSAGPPEGSPANANDFRRVTAADNQPGAGISTPDTVFLGFGLEGIASAAARNDVVGRLIRGLLGPAERRPTVWLPWGERP
ncbi:MAG: immune inhibitor A [Ardenticatenales bacterium]|nr:immune inhibitor A [Ardenticatenales bacterium]